MYSSILCVESNADTQPVSIYQKFGLIGKFNDFGSVILFQWLHGSVTAVRTIYVVVKCWFSIVSLCRRAYISAKRFTHNVVYVHIYRFRCSDNRWWIVNTIGREEITTIFANVKCIAAERVATATGSYNDETHAVLLPAIAPRRLRQRVLCVYSFIGQ